MKTGKCTNLTETEVNADWYYAAAPRVHVLYRATFIIIIIITIRKLMDPIAQEQDP